MELKRIIPPVLSRERRQVGGFVGGVVCTQFVNSAFHLAQPLLMADITGSIGHAAFFASFDTAVHMGGTFLGGWPVDRFGARRVLILATWLRALALAAIPLGILAGAMNALWAMSWYTLDALIRGFVDAAVYTLPMEFAEHEAEQLDRLNSRYELAFDFGGILGPLAFGAVTYWFHGPIAHATIPIGFALAALVYSSIPATVSRPKTAAAKAAGTGTLAGLRAIAGNRDLLMACIGYMSFNIYPLRKLLSAFFAKAILMQPAAAGVLGSAFSAGGLVGALVYARFGDLVSRAAWVLLGAMGLLSLGFGWVPQSLAIMAVASFAFAATNTGARLTLTLLRQERTPLAAKGGVTAVSRFLANLVSVIAKAAVGAAFSLGATPALAFSIVGGLLTALAAGQVLLLAGKVNARAVAAAETVRAN